MNQKELRNEVKNAAFCLFCGRIWSGPCTPRDHACRGCGTPWGWRGKIDRDELLSEMRAALETQKILGDAELARRQADGALIRFIDDPEISRKYLEIICLPVKQEIGDKPST